ncbi:lipoprotein-releasing system transmembrane subunit LolC, partial [Escherichia coli]
VMALIVVLSVMNGFQKEVRDRMLNVIAHVELLDYAGQALPDWQATAAKARARPEVVGAAPFIATQSLIAHGGDDMRGAVIRGISPADEAQVTGLGAQLKDGAFARLQPGAWN